MKITNCRQTEMLPEIIASCSGTVSLVLNQKTYPLNDAPGTLAIFKKLWNRPDFHEAELKLANPGDLHMLLELAFRGTDARFLPKQAAHH